MGLLGGQAKAMVVTSARKEAVRYKLGFDKYNSGSRLPKHPCHGGFLRRGEVY